VDPDNRRPVDYVRRRELLQVLMTDMADTQDLPQRARALLDTLEDGRAKLYVTWKSLGLRRRYAAHFQQGEYLPLTVLGANADCLCAHAWRYDNSLIIAAAPRWFAGLMTESKAPPLGVAVWRETRIELPPESMSAAYVNLFTGERNVSTMHKEPERQSVVLGAAQLFAYFPVALLQQELVKEE